MYVKLYIYIHYTYRSYKDICKAIGKSSSILENFYSDFAVQTFVAVYNHALYIYETCTYVMLTVTYAYLFCMHILYTVLQNLYTQQNPLVTSQHIVTPKYT